MENNRSKERTDELRKKNVRQRSAIRDAFKSHPNALEALVDLFDHSAERIGKANGNQVFIMLGHKEVMETITRIDAMGHEDEIISVKE